MQYEGSGNSISGLRLVSDLVVIPKSNVASLRLNIIAVLVYGKSIPPIGSNIQSSNSHSVTLFCLLYLRPLHHLFLRNEVFVEKCDRS